MKSMRLSQIEQYILKHGAVSLPALCEQFGVSIHTIRRDVAQLVGKGVAEKVYGGVRAVRNDYLMSFEERNSRYQSAKAAIGLRAAELVKDGDIIFVDSGTTTVTLIPGLARLHGITVITNNLQAMVAAMPYENLNVLSLPGQLQRKTNSFTGLDAVRFLQAYNIKTAFMAATAASLTQGVMNSSPLEYELKRAAMERSERKVLLINSEKLGKSALLTYAPLEAFDCIVTDAPPGKPYTQALAESGTELIIAKVPE